MMTRTLEREKTERANAARKENRRNRLKVHMAINITAIIICALAVYCSSVFLNSVASYKRDTDKINSIKCEGDNTEMTYEMELRTRTIENLMNIKAANNDVYSWCYLSGETVTGRVTRNGLVVIFCFIWLTAVAIGCFCIREWWRLFYRSLRKALIARKKKKEAEKANAEIEANE